jgi:hypothetical protein
LRFPTLCGIATGAMIVAMVMDHRKQEAKMGQKETAGDQRPIS